MITARQVLAGLVAFGTPLLLIGACAERASMVTQDTAHTGGENWGAGWVPYEGYPTTTTTTPVPEPAPVVEPEPVSPPQARTRAPRTTAAQVVVPVGGTLASLRECESGGDYSINTGNGYYGGYQADIGTWGGYGGYPTADLAPPAVQDAWALELIAARGMAPWPTCGRGL